MQNIYLDNAATTPIAPEVKQVIIDSLNQDNFGNPASIKYKIGWNAWDTLEQARLDIATFLNCEAHEIIFCGSSTESINLAIRGWLNAQTTKKSIIITSKTEHNAVLNTTANIEQKKLAQVYYLNVDNNGLIDLEELEKLLRANQQHNILISLMQVNNETGVIHPIFNIGELAKKYNARFHIDATQAIGKIKIDSTLNVDMLSFSGHKIYAPKGIGVLMKKQNLNIQPLIFGGGQEFGLRSGTPAIHQIQAIAKACELIDLNYESDLTHYRKISQFFLNELNQQQIEYKIHSQQANKVDNIINIHFNGVDNESLLKNNPHIGLSTGSACDTKKIEVSHVLKAMGVSIQEAMSSVRISFGRYNNIEEIKLATESLINTIKTIKTE